jgi:hypothetical protein
MDACLDGILNGMVYRQVFTGGVAFLILLSKVVCRAVLFGD